jgi:hypothetical protein
LHGRSLAYIVHHLRNAGFLAMRARRNRGDRFGPRHRVAVETIGK